MPWNIRGVIYVINCGKADLDSYLFFKLCQNILQYVYTSDAPGGVKFSLFGVLTKTIQEPVNVELYF